MVDDDAQAPMSDVGSKQRSISQAPRGITPTQHRPD
jgi:hypothetical protein